MNPRLLLLMLLLIGYAAAVPANSTATDDELIQIRRHMGDQHETRKLLQTKAMLDAYIANNPPHCEAYMMRGLCKCWTDDWTGGIIDLKQATLINNDSLQAFVHLSNALARDARWAEAWEAAEHAIRINPQDPGGYMCEAKMRDVNGLTAEALQKLTDAQRKHQWSPKESDELTFEFCIKLARRALDAEDLTACHQYLNRAPQLAHRMLEVKKIEAIALIKEKKFNQAIAALNSTQINKRADPTAVIIQANANIGKGDLPEAIRLLNLVKSQSVNDIEWWHLQIALADSKKDSRLKQLALENCIRLAPNNPYWRRMRAIDLIHQGLNAEAAIAMEQARVLDPDDRNVLGDQLNLYRRLADHPRERSTLDRLVGAIEKEHRQSLNAESLADLCRTLEKRDEAIKLYTQCVKLEPRNQSVRDKRDALVRQR